MIYDPLVSVKSEFGQSSLSNRRFGSDESTETFSNKVQSEKSNFQKSKDLGNSHKFSFIQAVLCLHGYSNNTVF